MAIRWQNLKNFVRDFSPHTERFFVFVLQNSLYEVLSTSYECSPNFRFWGFRRISQWLPPVPSGSPPSLIRRPVICFLNAWKIFVWPKANSDRFERLEDAFRDKRCRFSRADCFSGAFLFASSALLFFVKGWLTNAHKHRRSQTGALSDFSCDSFVFFIRRALKIAPWSAYVLHRTLHISPHTSHTPAPYASSYQHCKQRSPSTFVFSKKCLFSMIFHSSQWV